jgi:hypothetical protein
VEQRDDRKRALEIELPFNVGERLLQFLQMNGLWPQRGEQQAGVGAEADRLPRF